MNKKPKQRTADQNKSLHLLCNQVADYCVAHGITAEMILRGFDVYPTMETIKMMIRQAGRAKYGKDSTSDLTTTELQACYEDVVARHIAEKTGEYFHWPSQETTAEALEAYEKYM